MIALTMIFIKTDRELEKSKIRPMKNEQLKNLRSLKNLLQKSTLIYFTPKPSASVKTCSWASSLTRVSNTVLSCAHRPMAANSSSMMRMMVNASWNG
jgi:hypothetical protein